MTLRALLLPLPLLLALAAPAQASSTDLFYERSVVGAAAARCHLFEPQVAAALSAATRQARGAALRAGADADALDAAEARATSRAAGVACNSPDLAKVAARVKVGFTGYIKLTMMSFPGGLASWRAERASATPNSQWRLSQSARTPQGTAVFGLAASATQPQALTAVAAWPGALTASGARLIVRDQTKAPRAYLDLRRMDLSSRMSPRVVTRAFLASAREPALPGSLPAGATTGVAFRFPDAAVAALERLDPREAVMVEFVYPTRDGERVESAAFEVGDFAAGRAFLAAGH